MILPRAVRAIDPLLRQCCVAAIAGGEDRVIAFEALPGVQAIAGTHAVMLSISSHSFRMIVLLHHARDEATRAYFAGLHQRSPQDFDDQAFMDALAECGNLLCGTLNRELGRSVPQLGMSTPHVIGRQSMGHLSLLRHGLERHWRLSLQGGQAFDFSLVLCDHGDVDFDHQPACSEQAETAGELEFF
jgi:hypothetical protein